MNNDDERIAGLDDVASLVEMRRRHLDHGLRLQAIGLRALEEWEQKIARGESLNLSPADAKAMLDVGVEIEQSALAGKRPDDGDAAIPKAKKPN